MSITNTSQIPSVETGRPPVRSTEQKFNTPSTAPEKPTQPKPPTSIVPAIPKPLSITAQNKVAFASGFCHKSMPFIEALEKDGFEVIFCKDAEALLALFKPGTKEDGVPDLVVIDGALPHKNELATFRTTKLCLAILDHLQLSHYGKPVIAYTWNMNEFNAVKKLNHPNFRIFPAGVTKGEVALTAYSILAIAKKFLPAPTAKIPDDYWKKVGGKFVPKTEGD